MSLSVIMSFFVCTIKPHVKSVIQVKSFLCKCVHMTQVSEGHKAFVTRENPSAGKLEVKADAGMDWLPRSGLTQAHGHRPPQDTVMSEPKP